MRLSATTTATTTAAATTTTRRKAKQTLQASRATAAAAATTRILTATTATTSTRATRQIECFICNLLQLIVLTTTAITLTISPLLGMALAQEQPEEPQTNRVMLDAFGGQLSFDQLPQTDFASSMLAASAVDVAETAETAATTAALQFTTTHPHAHTHGQQQHRTHTTTAATLRVSYDSNEIDNSYAVAGAAAAAAAAAAAEAADDGGDADDADDVERIADDYVMALGQGRNKNTSNNEPSDSTAPKVTPATTTTTATNAAAATTTTTNEGRQLMNAKTQDLLSLSQLASYQASTSRTPHHEKSAGSMKNSIAPGGTFQQIGSQRINGNVPVPVAVPVPAEAATTVTTFRNDSSSTHHHHPHGQQVGQQQAAPTQSTSSSSSSSIVRTSARKVDSKFVLPKQQQQQKTDAPMLNYIFDTHSSANKHHHHDQRYGPHFEDVQRVGQPTNLTVQAGSSIHLNCRISLLQDKTVSWVRRSAQNEENALDLLTVGLHAYTGDKRYKMEFQYPNNWRLKIINVKKDDEATYECQISTHPPRVIQINLHVNAPKVMIVDEYGDPLQEKYYEIDSTLQLSCVVRNVAMTSSVVFWKHSENVLNYDVTRGGVSVKTELMEDGANSTLSIAKIHKADSGNYTCSISEFQNFTIVVHILNGESFAELHHGAAGQGAHATWQYICGLYFLLLLRWISSNTVYTFR